MNRVSVTPEVVRSVAKQLEHMENYDCMNTPDSVQWTQAGNEGQVRFRYELGENDGE